MTDDYRVKVLSNQEVHRLAKKARSYFNVADHRLVDVLKCLSQPKICRLAGERKLIFQVRSDEEMGTDDGVTTYEKDIVTISVKKSVREAAFMGVGRARNTLAHEIGHAMIHDGPPMYRRAYGNKTSDWIRSFESAEHQAKVFAPAFLINDNIARQLSSAVELSVEFGVSIESSEIYYRQLNDGQERAKNAERVRRIAEQLAADFGKANRSSLVKVNYLSEYCSVCRLQKIFPIGVKFMCEGCGTVFDRFQDGDRID